MIWFPIHCKTSGCIIESQEFDRSNVQILTMSLLKPTHKNHLKFWFHTFRHNIITKKLSGIKNNILYRKLMNKESNHRKSIKLERMLRNHEKSSWTSRYTAALDIIRICFDRRDYQNKRVITTRFMNLAIKQKEKMMGQSAWNITRNITYFFHEDNLSPFFIWM